MSDSSKAEGQVIREQFRDARRAEVPNLTDVRKCRKIFYEFLVDRTLEILEADRNKEILRIKLSVDFDVICNDSPVPNRQKGICSPIKTDEIRRDQTRSDDSKMRQEKCLVMSRNRARRHGTIRLYASVWSPQAASNQLHTVFQNVGRSPQNLYSSRLPGRSLLKLRLCA